MEHLKSFFLILEFPINLFWSLPKVSIEFSGPWIIRSRRYNAKFGRPIQNHFSGKTRQNLKLSKNFLSIFKFPLSGVCKKPKSDLVSGTMLVPGFRLTNLVEEYKTIFLRKHGKSWNSPKSFFLFYSFL